AGSSGPGRASACQSGRRRCSRTPARSSRHLTRSRSSAGWPRGGRGSPATWTRGPGGTTSPGITCPRSARSRRRSPASGGCGGTGTGIRPPSPGIPRPPAPAAPPPAPWHRAVRAWGWPHRRAGRHVRGAGPGAGGVSWPPPPKRGGAPPDIPAVDALLEGYQAVRSLSRAELAALPPLLPVVHIEYALSEVEYFASVVRSPTNADLAYHTYLVGHTRWFGTPEGRALLSHLPERADRRRAVRSRPPRDPWSPPAAPSGSRSTRCTRPRPTA